MRDRLIKLLNKKYDHFCDQCGVNKDSRYTDSLADYLLENGVIVPPLKMGDKVWIIDWCYEVNEYEITHIRYNRDLNGQRFSYDAIMVGKNGADIGFADEDIGQYVFLAREEAEAKLKGGAE